jgi:hypothetical protein
MKRIIAFVLFFISLSANAQLGELFRKLGDSIDKLSTKPLQDAEKKGDVPNSNQTEGNSSSIQDAGNTAKEAIGTSIRHINDATDPAQLKRNQTRMYNIDIMFLHNAIHTWHKSEGFKCYPTHTMLEFFCKGETQSWALAPMRLTEFRYKFYEVNPKKTIVKLNYKGPLMPEGFAYAEEFDKFFAKVSKFTNSPSIKPTDEELWNARVE